MRLSLSLPPVEHDLWKMARAAERDADSLCVLRSVSNAGKELLDNVGVDSAENLPPSKTLENAHFSRHSMGTKLALHVERAVRDHCTQSLRLLSGSCVLKSLLELHRLFRVAFTLPRLFTTPNDLRKESMNKLGVDPTAIEDLPGKAALRIPTGTRPCCKIRSLIFEMFWPRECLVEIFTAQASAHAKPNNCRTELGWNVNCIMHCGCLPPHAFALRTIRELCCCCSTYTKVGSASLCSCSCPCRSMLSSVRTQR